MGAEAGRGTAVLQAKPLDILDAGQDNVCFHADRTVQTVDFVPDERIKLVLRGGDSMHMQAAIAAHAVDVYKRQDLHRSDFEGNVMTEYEEKFSSEGARIYRLEARRRLPEFLRK